MKRISGTDLVRTHFPHAQRITAKLLCRAVACEFRTGWRACYAPTPASRDRLVVFVRSDDPMARIFELVLEDQATALPLGLIERQIGARIDSLEARDRLSKHGLIIRDLDSGAITLMGTCPRMARVINLPRYGLPKRGWKVRSLIPAVLGMQACPQKLHDDRRLHAALILDRLDIDATDLCRGGEWARLLPKWTIVSALDKRDAA